jgi:type I restriction enzyme, S subunit
MKLETFFEKFDHFADAPDAVEKMRALVLNLAVQGRLVSNSRENPLSAEQIAPEKQRKLRELNIRSHPETPQPTKNDFPFSLPESWHAVALGDLAFSCPTSYGEDPIPSLPKAGVVKVGNIDNQGGFKGQFSERGFMPDEIKSLLARRGDLMVVKSSGSAENVHSGKTALCTAEHDGKIVGTNFVLRLRLLGTPALPEYVWRVLTSRYSRAWIEGTVQTMTYPNLKWSDFARLPLPLPPLVEQKRIVAKVDELMALCDRLEAQEQERETWHTALARASLARFADAPTPANLPFLFHPSYSIPPADLRKTILTLAVHGKLVPQSTEPPIGTLESILAEASVNGVSKGPTSDTSATEILRISAGTSRSDFYVDEDDFKHVDLPSNEVEKFQLAPGDLLACRFNGNLHYVGRFSIYQGESGRVQVNPDKLIRFRVNTEYHSPRYICYAMNAASTREAIESMCATTAGNIGLSAGRLKTVEIPLPPLAEQRRIVAKVDQLMALVEALETQLAASHAIAEKLMEAVVAELTT